MPRSWSFTGIIFQTLQRIWDRTWSETLSFSLILGWSFSHRSPLIDQWVLPQVCGIPFHDPPKTEIWIFTYNSKAKCSATQFNKCFKQSNFDHCTRGRTHWTISGDLWEKLHPNISEKLSVSDQARSQILGKVWKMIPVKDQLLGQIWEQNQMIVHILNQETFQPNPNPTVCNLACR